MNLVNKLKMTKKKESIIRTIKWLIFIINDHNIQRCLITHEERHRDIVQARQIINDVCRSITSKKLYSGFNHLQFLIEILRDLNTSITLAEYAHYKTANSTLRNVLEHFLRLIYFSQYPNERDSFVFGIKNNRYGAWCSISDSTINKVNFPNKKIKEKFRSLYKKICKFTHSFDNSTSRNLVETTYYDTCLFSEWKSYFRRTVSLICKISDSFDKK